MNERGSTTLLTIMLVASLTLFCLFTLRFARHQYYSNLSRAKTYLCMKQQLNALENYTKAMKAMNFAIKVAHKTTIIPKMKIIHEGLQVLQQVYHVSFLHKFTTKGVCHFSQRLPFLYKLPYQHIGIFILKRQFDGSAKATKDKSWNVSITNYTAAKNEKVSFILKASLSFKNERLKLASVQEEAIKGWARSQLFSFLESLVR